MTCLVTRVQSLRPVPARGSKKDKVQRHGMAWALGISVRDWTLFLPPPVSFLPGCSWILGQPYPALIQTSGSLANSLRQSGPRIIQVQSSAYCLPLAVARLIRTRPTVLLSPGQAAWPLNPGRLSRGTKRALGLLSNTAREKTVGCAVNSSLGSSPEISEARQGDGHFTNLNVARPASSYPALAPLSCDCGHFWSSLRTST